MSALWKDSFFQPFLLLNRISMNRPTKSKPNSNLVIICHRELLERSVFLANLIERNSLLAQGGLFERSLSVFFALLLYTSKIDNSLLNRSWPVNNCVWGISEPLLLTLFAAIVTIYCTFLDLLVSKVQIYEQSMVAVDVSKWWVSNDMVV